MYEPRPESTSSTYLTEILGLVVCVKVLNFSNFIKLEDFFLCCEKEGEGGRERRDEKKKVALVPTTHWLPVPPQGKC